MKIMNTKLTTTLSLGLMGLAAGALLTGCASLPKDDANVQVMHFENLNASRYAEIFLVGGNGLTGNLKANVYNTLGLNGYNESNKDSAPQALAEAFNPKQVKKENHVLGSKLNGPKRWELDWIEVPIGTERDFCGLKARWCADTEPQRDEFERREQDVLSPHHGPAEDQVWIQQGHDRSSD